MAKNDKKEDVKPLPAPQNPPKPKEAPKPDGHFPPPLPKKHFGRKLLDLLTLVLAAGVVFLVYDLAETKRLYADTADKLRADCSKNTDVLAGKVSRMDIALKQLEKQAAESRTFSDEEYNRLLAEAKQQLLQVGDKAQEKIVYKDTESESVKTADEVLLASGAMIVRGLAESGQNFVYETEVLQILAQGNDTALEYVQMLKKYAVSGIRGRRMLIEEFNKIHAAAEDEKPEQNTVVEKRDENLKESFLRRLKNLVVLQKRKEPKPVYAKTPDEVYQLVNDGKFAEALNKLKTDSRYAAMPSPALQEWVLQVQSHLDFDRAVNGLIMNALANLRLKEFSRH